MRPSIYLDVPERAAILVDTSTDLRAQALRFDLPRVDAVLYTHHHADHIMGLDDLRRFNILKGGSIPCYADARTWEGLRRTFFYVFDDVPREGGGIPRLDPQEIGGPFEVGGVSVLPVPLLHGRLPVLGFRFGTFAYLTDCNAIPDASWPLLDGVDTVILDALRHRPHSTHFTVGEALGVLERLRPRRAFLTHICHDLLHAADSARLPVGVELAYDGLAFDVDVDAT